MLVGFIGAPNSGKTTVAAQVFAELKKSGQPNVEFVAEQARVYIARQKYGMMNDQSPVLDDSDQLNIYKAQRAVEGWMANAVGEKGIVICDSLALNSLWYMSAEFRQSLYRKLVGESVDYYGNQLIFYCPPVTISTKDSLRIHTPGQIGDIDEKIKRLLFHSSGTPDFPLSVLGAEVKRLVGPVDLRTNDVIRAIYERIYSR